MIDKYIIKATNETKIHIDGVSYDLDNVIAAIEKQIPKKPHKYHYSKIIKKGLCPRCFQTEDDSANYCRACGQALDWSK